MRKRITKHPFFKILETDFQKINFCIMMCVFIILPVSASSANQDKLAFTLENVSFEEVLAVIKDRTDYKFLYKNEDIDNKGKISIAANNETVEEVLIKLLENPPMSYKFMGKQIVLTKKETSAFEKVAQEREVTGNVKTLQILRFVGF